MSLKKKSKIEHSKSPKVQALRQIDNQIKQIIFQQFQNEKQNEVKLLERMQDKMGKIMRAYIKLEEENKRKDQIIKQLENQNLMLKQRIVEKSSLGDSRLSKSQTRKQSTQGMVIQRTFTPLDVRTPQSMNVKKEQPLIDQPVRKTIETYNPTSSIVQQYNPKLPSAKILRQSRSVQHLNKTAFQYQIKPENNFKIVKENVHLQQQNGTLSGQSNRINRLSLPKEDDRSFMDVLSKLKQKIKKFDEQESQTNKKPQNQLPQQSLFFNENQSIILSKVKSSDHFSRKTNMKQSRQKQQLQALRLIWDQRDQQIKRMDELFSKIDERLNI